ncbi:DUF397 domain-containing protein [Trebonia sp.]|uniref:DUF397 domain-containing protein n=1 Tax=Trebonia sp. TaxID=2767075 RepID=UPI002616D847|nr:DUF397 domain-containing protein [Trebonia sp.]
MTTPGPSRARWRRSTCSGTNGNCVETAASTAVTVRDSKDPDGTHLAFTPAAWQAFTATVKAGTRRA